VGARPGTVYLVGAGPGDPGLLTLRALELVSSADVILYDALAPEALLERVRPGAAIVYVGKKRRAEGDEPPGQAAINARLVAEAKAGRSVVRLKGGDPFVFGRGGEEALALVEAGVPFEVVPGITAGVAALAYAGIPLTHRELSSDAVLVTGHEHTGDTRVDWGRVAGAGTVVLYMAVERLGEIAAALIAHGRPADQPAAAVRWGTRPDQRVVMGTLGDIAARCAATSLKPPAVVVIGEVVRLRERLAWFEGRPLFGRVVALTRPADRAEAFRAALAEAGAEVVLAPAIETLPPEDPGALDAALEALATGGAYDHVVFTSRTAVQAVFGRLSVLGRDARVFGGTQVAAVGPGTAAALASVGLVADLVPDRHDAEGLLAAFEGVMAPGARILLPRSESGRDVFPDGVRALGGVVDPVVAYRTAPRPEAAAALRPRLEAGEIDAVVLASPSQVHALAGGLGGEAPRLLGACVIACIGEPTAGAARAAGLDPVVAEATDADAMVACLVRAFGSRGL
jgi:uroporphyrinogen III methyltransferase / synthase